MKHEITIHCAGPTHYWLTCSCGWRVDPVANNWDEWKRLVKEHEESDEPT